MRRTLFILFVVFAIFDKLVSETLSWVWGRALDTAEPQVVTAISKIDFTTILMPSVWQVVFFSLAMLLYSWPNIKRLWNQDWVYLYQLSANRNLENTETVGPDMDVYVHVMNPQTQEHYMVIYYLKRYESATYVVQYEDGSKVRYNVLYKGNHGAMIHILSCEKDKRIKIIRTRT